ncbi:MAG: hypothetical protein KBA26_13770 [Candidatus Delongbacteria bacterium]|nr:hypothetical protein [Candidatus Delongbacteria bacterium]
MIRSRVMTLVVAGLIGITGMIEAGIIRDKLSIAPFAGFGNSMFENHFGNHHSEQSFPVGLSVINQFHSNFFVSAGYEYSRYDFSVEVRTYDSRIYVGKNTVTQHAFTLNIHHIFPVPVINPFIGAGVGLYIGNYHYDHNEDADIRTFIEVHDYTLDYKPALGYNLNGGLLYNLSARWGLVGHYVYHIVDRKEDSPGTKADGMNNWAVHLGVRYQL